MNTISSSDETYLEAYIEQLTTSQWTYQVRRTMDLIRDLDTSCASDLQQLHHLTQQLHTQMEHTVIQNFDIVELNDDENDDIPEDVPDEIDELFGWNNKNNNSNKSSKDNSNKKRKRPQHGMRLVVSDNNTNAKEAPAMIPTTEELFEYVLQQPVPSTTPSIAVTTTTTTNTSSTSETKTHTLQDIYQQIQQLQQNCIQKSHEKVYVAQQAFEMIDAQVQRLDNDIHNMELLLQSTGEFPRPTMGVNTNSNPHQQQSQSQQQQQQQQSSILSSNMANHTNVNNTSSATTQHHSAAFRAATPQMVTPLSSTASLAACQVTPGSEYILCKILLHDIVHKTYKLADEDIESNKIFDLPESQVIVLNPIERLNKGDIIYAVYPDTTSFYQATVVVSTNKKTPANTNASQQQQIPPKQPTYVMVQFVDDADEFGITHDKAVPIQHVMIPPPQLLL